MPLSSLISEIPVNSVAQFTAPDKPRRLCYPLVLFSKMGTKIRVIPAEAEPFEVTIGNTATIGRTRENTVCLNFSPLVSRQHAIIRCHNGYQYQIIDLGSRNGTFVNDQRVVLPRTLENGARIRIANNELIFEQEQDDVSGEHLEVTIAGSMGGAHDATREVAMLVCDVRGSSTMAEKLPGEQLAQTLGEWFRESGNLIQNNGGTVDKFIGDAVLAYWLAADGPGGACNTAFEVGKQLLQIAKSRRWPGAGEPFRIAVALHFGRVTCGNVGLVAERDATIIGDAVNTVFRLESVMKSLNQRLAMSQDFTSSLTDTSALVDLGEQELRGKKQLVRVFGLTE